MTPVCFANLSWIWGPVDLGTIWHTGMSYLISLNPLLSKDTTHVGSNTIFLYLLLDTRQTKLWVGEEVMFKTQNGVNTRASTNLISVNQSTWNTMVIHPGTISIAPTCSISLQSRGMMMSTWHAVIDIKNTTRFGMDRNKLAKLRRCASQAGWHI